MLQRWGIAALQPFETAALREIVALLEMVSLPRDVVSILLPVGRLTSS